MLGIPGAELIEIRPRADQYYVSQSHSVIVTGKDGFIRPEEKQGVLIYQTRTISRYRYLLNGKEPQPAGLSAVRENSWLGYYIFPVKGDEKATKDTIEIRASRFAGHGFHEEIDLANHSQDKASFTFEIEVDCDFMDQSEMGSDQRQGAGTLTREWRNRDGKWELFFDFHAEHAYDHQGDSGVAKFHQSLALRINHAPVEPSYAEGRISFAVELAPHATWHACLDAIPTVQEKVLDPVYACGAFGKEGKFDRERERFLTADATHFETPASGTLTSIVGTALARASRDLAALRMHDLDTGDGWVPAAGTPEYVALYGRDAICISWQTAMLTPAMLAGTLQALASLQADSDDLWRDAQPGKIIHQASTGALSELNFKPFARYYGSLTSSGFYPFALAVFWQWTGDRERTRRFLDPALRALQWRDTGGDPDGDGFVEYLRHSEGGVKNQGWKDSGEAIVHADGSQVEPPIAPCEEQGLTYLGKLRMAETLWWLGDRDLARKLFHQASELKKRFNDVFWMPDQRFFAMGLDRHKRPIRSISSNGGHVLETGIVDDNLVQKTADRLMEPDLFNGWGVRTLSDRHPAYNPFSYQRGSVWPAENSLFALGMFRFGLHHYADRICRAQFEAAAMFEHYRLPELFGGQARDAGHAFPGLYPEANWPQAWSAGAVFCFLSSLLGMFPYAPLNTLFVDPHLPEWLPEITLTNLHIGDAVLAIRFRREKNGESTYSVLDLRGKLHVIRQASPWSLTATLGERFEDALLSLIPG